VRKLKLNTVNCLKLRSLWNAGGPGRPRSKGSAGLICTHDYKNTLVSQLGHSQKLIYAGKEFYHSR